MRALFLSAAVFLPTVLFAQTKPVTPPLQTAREALIETIAGGQKGIAKHLTVEVQDLLREPATKSDEAFGYAFFLGGMHLDSGEIQTFSTGSLLCAINDPAAHTKVEVHIENDDLSGDQDLIELSLHSFKDGQEQQDNLTVLGSHITVSMKKQQNIWRLNKIAFGMEFPVGDPEFLKNVLLKGHTGVVADTGGTKDAGPEPVEQHVEFSPLSTIELLAAAEQIYAALHPDIGFTCSVPDLTEPEDLVNLKPQLSAGSSSYRFRLTGCEGKPAGSFQAIIEPSAASAGAQAFCTDATRNIRISEDGSGSSCLSSGKPYNHSSQSQQEGLNAVSGSVDIHVHSETPKQ